MYRTTIQLLPGVESNIVLQYSFLLKFFEKLVPQIPNAHNDNDPSKLLDEAWRDTHWPRQAQS